MATKLQAGGVFQSHRASKNSHMPAPWAFRPLLALLPRLHKTAVFDNNKRSFMQACSVSSNHLSPCYTTNIGLTRQQA